MGAVLAILAFTPILGPPAIFLVSELDFAITAGAAALGLIVLRDEPTGSVNLYAPTLAAKFDTRLYGRQLEGQQMEMKWWDRHTGEAYVCWKDHPENCGTIYNLFLFCWDWRQSGVPGDIPRHGYSSMETYTPNGTVSMKMPLGDGPFVGYACIPHNAPTPSQNGTANEAAARGQLRSLVIAITGTRPGRSPKNRLSILMCRS